MANARSTSRPDLVSLSAIDEERFGIRTARAPRVSADTLPEVLEFCRDQSVVLLIARCAVADLPAAQAMERAGFLLMDTLVYYARDLGDPPLPAAGSDVVIRPVRAGDEAGVRQVAAEAFRAYLGHYHADPRLDRRACDETYASWAERSCRSREVADEVLVAEVDGRVAGFLTLRMNDPAEAEVPLNAVAPAAQGRGLYRALVLEALAWGRARNAARLIISTQITNLAVQRVWSRLGFAPSHAYYTFHRWFDAGA